MCKIEVKHILLCEKFEINLVSAFNTLQCVTYFCSAHFSDIASSFAFTKGPRLVLDCPTTYFVVASAKEWYKELVVPLHFFFATQWLVGKSPPQSFEAKNSGQQTSTIVLITSNSFKSISK